MVARHRPHRFQHLRILYTESDAILDHLQPQLPVVFLLRCNRSSCAAVTCDPAFVEASGMTVFPTLSR
jgi:hypothetical protein